MAEVALAAEAARLTELSRALRAAARSCTLYPEGHPAIKTTLGRLTRLTSPPRLSEPLRIGVTTDTLLIDGLPIGKPDAAIEELAGLLHGHMVGELTVAPGGSQTAWRQFLLLLERPADEVRADGGIAQVWAEHDHAHVELREINYAEVLRERPTGVEATWERVIHNCLTGGAVEIPDSLLDALLDASKSSQVIADVIAAAEKCDAGIRSVKSRADALTRLLGGIARAVSIKAPDQLDPVMRDMSSALGRLAPEMLLGVINRARERESTQPGAEGQVAGELVDRMTDGTVASFVARNAAPVGAPVERVVQAFQSLVSDGARRERLVRLAEKWSRQAHSAEPNFEDRWRLIAEKLLRTYADEPYVPASYASELNQARARAIQIEQLNEDPPERITAWLETITTTELRKLDLSLIVDLLRIEQEPARRDALAGPVLTILSDLFLVGDFESAELVLGALHEPNGRPESTDDTTFERGVLDRLVAEGSVQQLVDHLPTLDQLQFDRAKAVCALLGGPVVEHLTMALVSEERTRACDRLTEILVAFGNTGRAHVERLKESPDPAVRRTAVYLLREFGVSESLPSLSELLNDAEANSQRAAVHTIVKVGTMRGYHLLVQALTGGTPCTRERLMRALAARDDRTVPLLAHVLDQVSHRGELAHVYEQALELLAQSRHAAAVPALRAALERGEWWSPRRTAALRDVAATGLAHIGTDEAVTALREIARRGPLGARKAARARLATVAQTDRRGRA